MCACVQPRRSPRENLNGKSPRVQVSLVNVADLELTAGRRSKVLGHIDNVVVVEVKARDGIMRFWLRWLFFDPEGAEL